MLTLRKGIEISNKTVYFFFSKKRKISTGKAVTGKASTGKAVTGKAVTGKAVASSGSQPASGKGKTKPARSRKAKVETRAMRKRRRESNSDTDDSRKELSENEDSSEELHGHDEHETDVTASEVEAGPSTSGPSTSGPSTHAKLPYTSPETMPEKNARQKQDPTVSYVQTAKQLGVSRQTVSRGLGDVGLRSYVRRYRALISSGAMVKRVERSEDLLEWICAHPNTVIIFSDKVRYFTVALLLVVVVIWHFCQEFNHFF